MAVQRACSVVHFGFVYVVSIFLTFSICFTNFQNNFNIFFNSQFFFHDNNGSSQFDGLLRGPLQFEGLVLWSISGLFILFHFLNFSKFSKQF